MIIHGSERPKYTISCITNDMMPVARTSFRIYSYPDSNYVSVAIVARSTLRLKTEVTNMQPMLFQKCSDENSTR